MSQKKWVAVRVLLGGRRESLVTLTDANLTGNSTQPKEEKEEEVPKAAPVEEKTIEEAESATGREKREESVVEELSRCLTGP